MEGVERSFQAVCVCEWGVGGGSSHHLPQAKSPSAKVPAVNLRTASEMTVQGLEGLLNELENMLCKSGARI